MNQYKDNVEEPKKSKRRLIRFFNSVDTLLEKFERFVMAWGIIALAVISIANVLSRTVFDWGFMFIEEVSQFIVIMITFLGVGYATRHARHIRMSAIYDIFSVKVRKIMIIFISFITGCILFYLSYYSIQYVINTFRFDSVTPIIRFPLWIVYFWVPIGLTIGGVHYFLTIYKNIISEGVFLSISEEDIYADENITTVI